MIDPVSAFRSFVQRRTGVVIPEDRAYLIASRLGHLVKTNDTANLDRLIERIVSSENAELVNASRSQRRRLRIWSAACSRGQEAYSIAMLLEDMSAQLRGWQIEIVASDISSSAVEQAREGLFNQFEVQRGLPVTHLLRHFTRDGEQWRISERLRSVIDFRQHNLLDDFSLLGTFDIIFCRNVLIYFDVARRNEVLGRIKRQTAPDGLIILGGTEASIGLDGQLRPVAQAPGVFRPPQKVAQCVVG